MAFSPSAVASTIEVVRKRIQQIRERREIIGEENTKATLIDPLLETLGWDLREIDEVRREYRRKPQDNPVDYALFLNRTECLFIEAKSLEKDLGDHRWVTQNLSYATAAGVQWCVLTNGDEYRIYNAHAPVAVEEKLFRSVRITVTEPEYLVGTLQLLSKEQMRGSLLEEMWKRHFVDRRVHQAVESLFAEQDGRLVSAIRKKAGALSAADIRASLKRARMQMDFPTTPVPALPPISRGEVANQVQKSTRSARIGLSDLIAGGIVQPPLEIESDYKGIHLMAVIQPNGRVEFSGKQYDSLSTAGGMARRAVLGGPPDKPYPPTDGWTFWLYRDKDTGELREMDYLRKQYLATKE